MADDFTPDPSQKGNGLMGIDPELVMHMGLGLMSAAKYGGNIGDSLQQAYQGYQVGKLRKQQIQMGAVDQALMIGALQRRGLIPPGGGPQGPNVPGSMPVMPGQGAQSPFFASNQPMVPPQQSAPSNRARPPRRIPSVAKKLHSPPPRLSVFAPPAS